MSQPQTIIGNLQHNMFFVHSYFHVDRIRMTMFHHIAQRFLGNAKKGKRGFGRQWWQYFFMKADVYAGLILNATAKPAKSQHKPQILKLNRMKAMGKLAR